MRMSLGGGKMDREIDSWRLCLDLDPGRGPSNSSIVGRGISSCCRSETYDKGVGSRKTFADCNGCSAIRLVGQVLRRIGVQADLATLQAGAKQHRLLQHFC